MSIVSDKEWYDLPYPAAAARLVEMRTELRQKNLHDTEEPAARVARDARPGRSAHDSHERRNLQRSALPAHGERRRPLRPQRAPRRDRAGCRQPAEPESAHGEPRAPDAHDVPARRDRERARRRMDPVPGARLVRAQEGRREPHARYPDRGRRFVARASDARPGHARRHAQGARTRRGRRRTRTKTRTGGMARRCTAARPPSRRRCASAATGSSWSARAAVSASIAVTGSEITGFTENSWVGLSLLHGLFALEHNAICDMLRRHNAQWDDERLFQQARLVNAALLAKIHTVEWTTGDPAESDHAGRAAHQLAGRARRSAEGLHRPQRQRAARRYSGVADGSLRARRIR